jgi:hypothetical protein
MITKIELTNEDAVLFQEFQEHYQKIVGLLKGDLMTIKNGTIIMDFDSDGNLRKVRKEYTSYSN